ncbi:glycosyltransferase family 2 protein [Mucilaginibacter sp. OK283]|jgi:dolichol-phosphate mannosyltransferase|uniref:glycosyltransferase family 2 protein n=1 Tax=Mucilaginibacter sp. OK283 TaxID=1881049 RepID=UPI0008B5AF40|nr:glycosyltransferase family 2 protein [Mucilaginibacter sp. OK283]SEP37678.1 dolichol-phosphate mannosyltransferase [Mucilaginibacter sp. OK283]
MISVSKKKLSVIIPCHNEQNNVGFLIQALTKTLNDTRYNFELIFVDDGSTDNTVDEIKFNANIYSNVFYVELSKNFGKDNALKAGIAIATGNAVITMDADMQHPPQLILKMLEHWENGYDIVYTYRENANPHAKIYQKVTSKLFYKGINMLSDIKLEDGTADFRLMDENMVSQLKLIDEHELFLRGIIKWTGFKQVGIPYTPSKRHTGEVSYSFIKLVKLAIGSIMAFSARPLYIMTGVGLTVSLMTIFYIPYVLISFAEGYAVNGWASIIATIAFFGGLQLMVLSIIGVYVGKIFMQSKARPNYLVRSTNLVNINNDLIGV